MSDTYLNASGLSTLVEKIAELTDLSGTGAYSTAVSGSSANGAVASGYRSTAVGANASASSYNASALGYSAAATANNSVALGATSQANANGTAVGVLANAATGSVAIGMNTACQDANYAVAIGHNAAAGTSTTSGAQSTVVGCDARAYYACGTALGAHTECWNQAATAVGYNANVSANYATAVGYNAHCSTAYATTIQGKGGVYITASDGDWQIPLIETGSVSITPTAANTRTNTVVNFSNSFSSAPKVFLSPYVAYPNYVDVSAYSVNTSAFTLILQRINTTATTVYWVAIGY